MCHENDGRGQSLLSPNIYIARSYIGLTMGSCLKSCFRICLKLTKKFEAPDDSILPNPTAFSLPSFKIWLGPTAYALSSFKIWLKPPKLMAHEISNKFTAGCIFNNGTNNCWFPLARKWPTWKWTWIWIPYGKIEKKCPRYFRRDSRGNPRDLNMCRTGRSAALSRGRKSMPPRRESICETGRATA